MPDTATGAAFRVIDGYDHPHGGRILRLRFARGDAPSLKELRGATLRGLGPRGESLPVSVQGFAVFGGRPKEARFAKTGRVDVRVVPDGSENGEDEAVAEIGPGWELVLEDAG